MLHHHIGKEVVAGDAAVLVRPFAEEQVCGIAVWVIGVAAYPKTSRLDIDFGGLVKVEGLVFGRSAILIERIDHIGGHMQLAAADVPGLTLLTAVHRRHPGIAGAFCIHPAGVLLRGLESACAVFTQTFGGSRIILQKERQHEEIRIPEIAALIARMRQPSRTDAHGGIQAAAVHHELQHGKTEGALQLGILFKTGDITCLPGQRPGILVLGKEYIKAPMPGRFRDARVAVTACCDIGQLIKDQAFSGLTGLVKRHIAAVIIPINSADGRRAQEGQVLLDRELRSDGPKGADHSVKGRFRSDKPCKRQRFCIAFCLIVRDRIVAAFQIQSAPQAHTHILLRLYFRSLGAQAGTVFRKESSVADFRLFPLSSDGQATGEAGFLEIQLPFDPADDFGSRPVNEDLLLEGRGQIDDIRDPRLDLPKHTGNVQPGLDRITVPSIGHITAGTHTAVSKEKHAFQEIVLQRGTVCAYYPRL